jgi:hypothetical protein
MSAPSRFFLGRGENLITGVSPSSGPVTKDYPYDFDEACSRLSDMVGGAVAEFESLPTLARPAGQVVGQLTIHPRGLARSYHPGDLLRDFGLRQIGSRRIDMVPEKDTVLDGEVMESAELYVAGALDDFQRLSSSLARHLPGIKDDRHNIVRLLESFAAPDPAKRTVLEGYGQLPDGHAFETVLHLSKGAFEGAVARGFNSFAQALGVEIPDRKAFQVGGLKFVPIVASAAEVEELAKFAFLRVVRPMPRLRSVGTLSRSNPLPAAQPSPLPRPSPDAKKLRVAVFDGGLEDGTLLAPYATSHEVEGIGPAEAELVSHGFDVTSALLFGSLEPGTAPPAPEFHIDHYRVLDTDSKDDPFELYDVLARVQSVLEEEKPKFVNLSLGPALPADDHDIHAWTAVLDEYAADSGALITVAAGNTGTRAWPESRVQVPGDAVNMLCVGAADTRKGGWAAASYSSFGPGRRPGVIKPDLLAFGGTVTEPFIVYDRNGSGHVAATAGTSFASPLMLKTAATIRSRFGSYVGPLAAKALLINSSEPGSERNTAGWGRAAENIDAITVCGDGMVRVLYQGELHPSKTVRARIPIPHHELQGNVTITATLCYLSPTDPEDPTSYTRAGIDVTFRPDVTKNPKGKKHPETASFFRNSDYDSEADLRKAAYKWETVMHSAVSKRGRSLIQPCFDIHYIAREGGGKAAAATPIPYAMVITVTSARTSDLYERVVREYQGVLAEVQPLVQVQLQVEE